MTAKKSEQSTPQSPKAAHGVHKQRNTHGSAKQKEIIRPVSDGDTIPTGDDAVSPERPQPHSSHGRKGRHAWDEEQQAKERSPGHWLRKLVGPFRRRAANQHVSADDEPNAVSNTDAKEVEGGQEGARSADKLKKIRPAS